MTEKHEAERIARAINLLRPDWPIKQIMTIIGRDNPDGSSLRHRPYRDIAIALTWIATDPDSRTPARVTEDGPWWHAVAATRPGRSMRSEADRAPSPRSHEICTQPGHSGWATNCPQCRSEAIAIPEEQP